MKTKGKGRGVKRAKGETKKKSFKRAYLTKAQAVRQLQITGSEFDRLVILKGIFPREPKRFEGSSGKDKTYYFSKDVLWLEREPLLQKMREFSTFKKKLTRLRGRRQDFSAKLYEKQHKPHYAMSTILKERYPTFIDAVKDLDDALTHVFLYAAMPPQVHSDSTIEGHSYLTSAMSEQCRELRDRWLKYVRETHGLRKGFISIKGLYYQADVKGEKVMWQCPYEFTNKAPKDVVHRILVNFLELYLQHLRFVLFKLEHDMSVAKEKEAEEEDNAANDAEDFPETEEEQARRAKLKKHIELFKGKVFYISRECPQLHIQFIVECFHGRVSETLNKSVTHYIIDRPKPAEEKQPGIDYVQPQWLFDCINAKGLLPVDEYLMGKALPPHISPFRISIANDPNEMKDLDAAVALDRRVMLDDVPDRVHEIRRMLDPSYNKANPTAEVHLSDDDEDEEDLRDAADAALESSDGESVSEDGEEERSRVKENIERSKASKKKLSKLLEKGDNKPTEKEEAKKRAEKIASKKEERAKESVDERKKRRLEEAEAQADAELQLKKAVMPNKARKLFTAMEIGNKRRKRQLKSIEDRREMVREGKAVLDKKSKTLKVL